MPVLKILAFSFTTAKQVWEAPGELQELSSELLQLDTLGDILRSLVEAQGEGNTSVRALEPAIARLNNARKVFEERLSKTRKTKSAGTRFKRRTWMRHHGEIKKVMRDVMVVRKDLTAVMLLLNLTSVNTLQAQQLNLLRLMGVSQFQLGNIRGTLPALEESQNLEQSISALAHSRAQLCRGSSDDELHEKLPDLDDFLDAVSEYSEEVSEVLPFLTPGNRSLTDCSFETSRPFFPEKYVMSGPVYERLAIHITKEINRTATTRVDEYCLLFAKDSRHWNRVVVTATTTKEESKLSELASSSSPSHRQTLPGLVRPRLEAMLDATDLYGSVTNISIQLETSDEGDITFNPMKAKVSEDFREASIRNVRKDIEEIEHQGLPQYLESEVVVLAHVNNHGYIVLVESQLCIEHKFPFTGLSMSGYLADMRLLLIAQGCPGVARFVGVVLSDDRGQIRSYLTQYDGQCSMFRIMLNQSSGTKSIQWKRRERWIRQAITLVAEVHRRGIVLGALNTNWIEVDSKDNISCRLFTLKGNYIHNSGGCLPPEMRSYTDSLACAHDQELTFMSDMFQLGLFIWMIAQQIPLNIGCDTFCSLTQCPTVPRSRCTADHANPIQLPACSSSEVPVYIDNIISYCRHEQPYQRKPAVALLELLPPDEGQYDFAVDADTFSAFQDISLGSKFQWVACDECGLEISGKHYHCNVCHEGDFDLCPECVSSGITCLDNSHKLSHRVFKDGLLIVEPSRNESTG
ncbi:MAG: hypothetical protein Q9160_001313 [Pyrenula sp. 1 TL-2023]